jgi:polysaccharide deacetylase family protein (PEP-CTERM system associated)
MHDTYGIPDARRFPHTLQTASGPLIEFPLTTLPLKLGSKEVRLPIAGGGYLRLFPAQLLAWGIKRINSMEQQPAVLYFHPWEIDPDQPRIREAGLKSRFRHYLNLNKTEDKLRYLYEKLQFGTMKEVLDSHNVECTGG